MDAYVDTSALVKLFHREVGTIELIAFLRQTQGRVLVCELTRIELVSAFAVKIRSGQTTKERLAEVVRQFAVMMVLGEVGMIGILRPDYEVAAKLIERWGDQHRLRSLDALHLAVALRLHGLGKAEMLIPSDEAMASVARQEGLAVWMPPG